jgi:hypothetical protein
MLNRCAKFGYIFLRLFSSLKLTVQGMSNLHIPSHVIASTKSISAIPRSMKREGLREKRCCQLN